jgi:hypothetical protein
MAMTARQRLQATLNHEPVDRLCVDFGAGATTGMGVGAVHRLRQAILRDPSWRVKVIEPYQMLGEIDEELRQALRLDVVGVHPATTMFGFRVDEGWKPFTMFDGTPVLTPENFNTTVAENGDLLIYPEGDLTAPPRGRMPEGGYFFDSIVRQDPIDESQLDVADNMEEFLPIPEEEARLMAQSAERYANETGYGVYLTVPGCAFGDIALVPAPWMKHPKGIRDIEEWYVSILTRPDYVQAVFDWQLECALQTIDRLAETVGDHADVAYVTGTDFGAQHGLFVSVDTYKSMFKPYHVAVNQRIHEKTNWKTFIHCCGSIVELIPEFIDAGFDVLNPVQCSAAGMEPRRLKREFGRDIVFWGGGVDTQKTLPFGSAEEVYREVRERIDIFFEDSTGFVFNGIHNVTSNVPTENLLAMFRALNDAHGACALRPLPPHHFSKKARDSTVRSPSGE